MQKPLLPLIILCIVALPFLGKAQSMYSQVEPNAKLKKGDWFNIEFADRLEDYSTPVDSINYCDPENLLQLVLHCEVTNVSKKKLNLKITLERLFHITDSGEYFDSYFDIYNDYHISVLGYKEYPENQYFEINTEVDLKNHNIKQFVKRKVQNINTPNFYYPVHSIKLDEEYGYISSGPDHKINYLKGNLSKNHRIIYIQISDIEELVEEYVKDWSTVEYNLPLPSFGNLKVADFRKYRIIDSNIPVRKNIILVIEDDDITTNELVEVLIKDEFDYLASPKIKYKLNGYLKDGRIVFEYYLEKQREMTLRYRGKEMNFISTPDKDLNLKLHLNNNVLAADFIGDNVGDNTCEKELASSSFTLPKSFDWDYFKDSYEIFHDTLEKKTQNYIRELNQYKNQMTVTRYKKKLKMIYYWAATQSAEWHPYNLKATKYVEFENWFDYTKLNEMSYYQNISPLYDYYLEPDFYKEYLKVYANISANQGYSKNLLTSEVQGFQRERFDPGYFLYNILFIGYPKYYYLAGEMIQPRGSLSRVKPGSYTEQEYNHFMATCDYPPFLNQVQKAYEMAIKTDVQKSILDLDLNIARDKNYQKNSGNYKLIGFFKDKIDSQLINQIRDSVINIENRFDLKYKIEVYLVYTDDSKISDVVEILPSNKDVSMKLIKLTMDEFYSDMENLTLLRYGDYPREETESVALITGKNEIIALGLGIRLLDFSFKQYENHLEYVKSQKNNSQLIIFILSSLLFFGLLSWFVIRVRTRQIMKRESARRKVSELELTAIRSQMNPHFIFNAMGSIQNLINQNKVKNANLYLASFARLMRMVLANSNKKLVSMSHELELIETYLKLEQLRVDFTFTISVAENIDPEVEELPGMLIQPFIENAVIHGITPKGKGNIDVAFTKKDITLICEITDDGVGIDTAKVANGNGLAMKLSEKRLDLLNSQLQDKLKLVVENRMENEQTSGTRVILYIPVG